MKLTHILRLAAALVLITLPMAGQATAASSILRLINNSEVDYLRIINDVATIRVQNYITGRDLDASLDGGYATGLFEAFKQATSTAKSEATNKVKLKDEGLIIFEDLALKHEKALANEVRANEAFMEKIRTGAVLIDPKVVAGWPARDQAQFKGFLAPGAVGKYPSLARLSALPPAADRVAAIEIATADCAVVAGCLTVCQGDQWQACLSCLLKAEATAQAAYREYQTCSRGAGKPRWMPLRVWQTRCLAKLVAVMA